MYGFLFGLLFIPKSYLHVPTYPEISISTFLNPLLMLIMIFAIAFGSLISQNQPEKDEVEYKAHTLKRKFVLLFFLLIVLVVFWPGMENKRKTISPNTVQELRLLAMRSERSADYSFAAGYYMQWTLLDTTTPENHLGLARVYLKMDRYWDSYQEYKKAALLSLKNSPSRLEAEVGLRMVSNDTICYMIKMKQFGWSRLIQDEYNDLFPDLPKTGSKKCSHN